MHPHVIFINFQHNKKPRMKIRKEIHGREEMKTSIVKIVLNPVIWTITKTNPRFQDRIILPEIIMIIEIS